MKVIYIGVAVVFLAAAAIYWITNKTKSNLPWARFTNAVYTAFPSQKCALAAGASDADIQRLKAAIPCPLPRELISALEHNNGGTGRHGDNAIYFGAIMLSVDGIIRDYENWVVISKEDPENYSDNYSSFPPDTIRPDYANAAWVPFAEDGAGNNIGIDYDPGPNGTSGQIISFGADEIEKLKIADSFAEFLDLMTGLVAHPQVKASDQRGFTFADSYIVDGLKVLMKKAASP